MTFYIAKFPPPHTRRGARPCRQDAQIVEAALRGGRPRDVAQLADPSVWADRGFALRALSLDGYLHSSELPNPVEDRELLEWRGLGDTESAIFPICFACLCTPSSPGSGLVWNARNLVDVDREVATPAGDSTGNQGPDRATRRLNSEVRPLGDGAGCERGRRALCRSRAQPGRGAEVRRADAPPGAPMPPGRPRPRSAWSGMQRLRPEWVDDLNRRQFVFSFDA